MNDLSIGIVGDDISFLGFFLGLCRATTGKNRPAASFFICDGRFDEDDTQLSLEIDRADAVLICLEFPSNLQGIARQSIVRARELQKPFGVYLHYPQLFCNGHGIDPLLEDARFVCIPDNQYLTHVQNYFPSVVVRVVSDVLKKDGKTPTRRGKFRLPKRLIAKTIVTAMRGNT